MRHFSWPVSLPALLALGLMLHSRDAAFAQNAAARAAAIVTQASDDGLVKDETAPVLFTLKRAGASRSAVATRIATQGSVRAVAETPGSDLETAFDRVFGGKPERAGDARAVSVRPSLDSPGAARVLGVGTARLTKDEIATLIASGDFEVSNDMPVQVPPDEKAETPDPGRVSRAAAGATEGVKRIQAPEVWAKNFKGNGVVVAVIDTGISKVAGFEGRFVDGVNTVTPGGSTNDDHSQSHGTHVAGTIGGSESSGVGVAVSAKLMPIKALDSSGNGTVGSISNGIVEALRLGADVINVSIEVDGDINAANRQIWLNAISAATKENCPVALAAGNHGDEGRQSALANAPDVIVVGAVDSAGNRASFTGRTSTGTQQPLIAAPGVKILSFSRSGAMVTMNGTSMATPHVAGVLALLKSKNKNITVAECRKLLQDHPLSGFGKKQPGITGAGVVDAFGVVTGETSTPPVSPEKEPPPGKRPSPETLAKIRALIDPNHEKTIADLNKRSDDWIEKYKDKGSPLKVE